MVKYSNIFIDNEKLHLYTKRSKHEVAGAARGVTLSMCSEQNGSEYFGRN